MTRSESTGALATAVREGKNSSSSHNNEIPAGEKS